VLINITGGPDLCLHEVNEAASMIQEEAHEDANIIFGAVIDENIKDEIRITVIATGFGEDKVDVKPASAPLLAPVRPAPPKNRKVIHLGTIIDDQDAPTWHRKKPGSEETETVTLGKTNFQFAADKDEDDKFDIPTFLRRQMD
jgi:cell division protein FtsZ